MAVFVRAHMSLAGAGPFMPERDEPALLRGWIERAKTGDASAFEHMVRAHEQLVLRTAQRMLANQEDAKDAAQEVFLRLYKSLSKLGEERELVPWLYRVTINICLDTHRRKPAAASDAYDVIDERSDPEEALATAQQKAMLHAALESLSPKERAALVLRDLEGCSTAETASILGSSEATVRSQISTGRVKIKQFLAMKLRRPR